MCLLGEAGNGPACCTCFCINDCHRLHAVCMLAIFIRRLRSRCVRALAYINALSCNRQACKMSGAGGCGGVHFANGEMQPATFYIAPKQCQSAHLPAAYFEMHAAHRALILILCVVSSPVRYAAYCGSSSSVFFPNT